MRHAEHVMGTVVSFDLRPAELGERAARTALKMACATLHEQVHGHSRANELREALARGLAWVALHEGRVVAYAAVVTNWLVNHGVGETEADMAALLAGAGRFAEQPLALLLPIRQAGLFRWCLGAGLRPVKPMVLMSKGEYREPQGAWFPSILY